VRDPARAPGHGEDRLPGARDHAGHADQGGQREVDVRLGQGAAARLGQHGVGDRIPRRPGRRLLHQVKQRLGPRVGAVREGAEAGNPLAPAHLVTDHAHRVGRITRRGQHRLGAEGAAVGDDAARIGVQHPAERAQAGRDHRVRIRADRGRHPGGERGRGEFMVGEQGHRGTQRAKQARIRPFRADLVPEPAGDTAFGQPGRRRARTGSRRRAARVGQAVDHPGDDVPASRHDRGRIQVQPERIGGRHGGDDHPQPFQRQGALRQRGLRAAARRHRRRGRLPRLGGAVLAHTVLARTVLAQGTGP
jgi:hypothetical protein